MLQKFAATRSQIENDPINAKLYPAAFCPAAQGEPSSLAPTRNGSSSVVCAQLLTCQSHQHAESLCSGIWLSISVWLISESSQLS